MRGDLMDELTHERYGPGIPYAEAYARPTPLWTAILARRHGTPPGPDSDLVVAVRRRQLNEALRPKARRAA
jgi:hypothetical protein